jgi:hypothetical protein
MRLELLQPEPELEFGKGGRCQDIRFGIGHYGAFDYDNPKGPRQIKLGLVGTDETVSGLIEWLMLCQYEIAAKSSRQPRLYPPFPGFDLSHGFYSKLTWDTDEIRTVKLPPGLNTSAKYFNQTIERVVDLYAEEVSNALEKLDVNVVICAPPLEHLRITTFNPEEAEEESDLSDEKSEFETSRSRYDFHDLLKAKTLHLRTPLQLVLPATYDESKAAAQKKIINRDQQDEATRAWNLHTALYYKARGVPWRMVREASGLSTCYLGVSFFRTLDQERIYASSAQVFNERGEGVIVRGGLAYEDKNDRQIYLDESGAYNLVTKALDTFWNEHFHYPARVALHKTSPFTDDETMGFTQALAEKGVEKVDLLHVKESYTRLFRTKDYPPLRGILWHIEDRRGILYTKGSVNFYETYPGKYPPRTLFLDNTRSTKSLKELAIETLALTKMNWNSTRFDGQLPITLRAAKQVGSILKYLEVNEVKGIPSAYRFYM